MIKIYHDNNHDNCDDDNDRDANPPDFIGRLPKIHPNSRPYDHPPNPPEITIFLQ